MGVTLTDMVHLGAFDPDANPPGFDFSHSTLLTRLQLLEFRGGSAPLVGPHPRSPKVSEVTLSSDDMDEFFFWPGAHFNELKDGEALSGERARGGAEKGAKQLDLL